MQDCNLLCKTSIPDHLRAVAVRLQNLYGRSLSVSDVLEISDGEFLAHRNIGQTHLKRFRILKSFLAIDSPEYEQTVLDNLQEPPISVESSGTPVPDLDGFRFLWLALSPTEIKFLRKFIRRDIAIDQITPRFILSQSAALLLDSPGFGEKSVRVLEALQARIVDAFGKLSQTLLIPPDYGKGFNISEISWVLVEDYALFMKNRTSEELFIWKSRTGYGNTPVLSLQEIADTMWVTRERIRQREWALIQILLNGLRITPAIIRAKIENLERVELFSEFATFRREFPSDKSFMKTLSLISGVPRRELDPQVSSVVSPNNNKVACAPVEDFSTAIRRQIRRKKIKSLINEFVGRP